MEIFLGVKRMIYSFLDDTIEIKYLLKNPGHADQSVHGNRYGHINGQRRLVQRGGKPGVLNYDEHGNPLIHGPALPPKPKKITPSMKLKQLEDEMSQKYPKTKFDFKSMHPDIAQRSANKISELLDQYPGLQDTIKYFGNGVVKGKLPIVHRGKKTLEAFNKKDYMGIAAHAQDNKGKAVVSILLNSDYTKDTTTFDKRQKQMYDSGFLATKTLEGVIAHETGHALNYHLLDNGSNKSFLPFIGDQNDDGSVSRTTNYWMNLHTGKGKTVSGYADYFNKTKPPMQANALLEQFAEGFAALHTPEGNKNHPYMKSMKTLLDMSFGTGGPMNKNTKKKKPYVGHIAMDQDDTEGYANMLKVEELYDKLAKSALLPDEIDILANIPEVWIEPSDLMPDNWKDPKEKK
jgi:hypothetical protein